MSHVKVCSSTTHHVLLAKFGEFPMEFYAPKLSTSSQQWFARLPSSWIVNQAISLSCHLAE